MISRFLPMYIIKFIETLQKPTPEYKHVLQSFRFIFVYIMIFLLNFAFVNNICLYNNIYLLINQSTILVANEISQEIGRIHYACCISTTINDQFNSLAMDNVSRRETSVRCWEHAHSYYSYDLTNKYNQLCAIPLVLIIQRSTISAKGHIPWTRMYMICMMCIHSHCIYTYIIRISI